MDVQEGSGLLTGVWTPVSISNGEYGGGIIKEVGWVGVAKESLYEIYVKYEITFKSM